MAQRKNVLHLSLWPSVGKSATCEVSKGTYRHLVTRSSYPCSQDWKEKLYCHSTEAITKKVGNTWRGRGQRTWWHVSCDFLPDDMNKVLLHISCYLHSSHFLSALADICNSRQRRDELQWCMILQSKILIYYNYYSEGARKIPITRWNQIFMWQNDTYRHKILSRCYHSVFWVRQAGRGWFIECKNESTSTYTSNVPDWPCGISFDLISEPWMEQV